MNEPFFFLIGSVIVLSLVLSPIVAIFALRRGRRMHDRVDVLEAALSGLERRVRELGREQRAIAAPGVAAVTTPAPATPTPAAPPTVTAPPPTSGAPPAAASSLPFPPSPPAPPPPPRLRVPLPSRPSEIPLDEPIPPTPQKPPINWELFTGARLFAWIGGIALFLGVAFLMKYSIDHGLISPALRIALGMLLGAGLVVGGLAMQRKGYAITAYTLCATGPAVLYATTFAAHNLYHFIGTGTTFALLALWTTVAFVLAVVLDARYIAVLAMIGGFLTPPLVSTGVDNPLGLFGYIALLDIGLAAVALRKRWGFLATLAAVGTAGMQLGWADRFFAVEKVNTAVTVFLAFPALFLAVLTAARKRGRLEPHYAIAAGGLHIVSLLFGGYLLHYHALASRPGLTLGFLFAIGLLLGLYHLYADDLARFHAASGLITFALLVAWTVDSLTFPLLAWALAFDLGFAVLYASLPLIAQRLRPGAAPHRLAGIFPTLMLLVVLIPIARDLTAPLLMWPIVLLLDAVAVMAALASGLGGLVVVVLLLTLFTSGLWMMRLPNTDGLASLIAILAVFVVGFFVLGLWLERRRRDGAVALTPRLPQLPAAFPLLPTLAALLPFLLLATVTAKLALPSPAPVFGLALLLVVMLLGLAYHLRLADLPPVALASLATLELVWQGARFDPAAPLATIAWYVLFLAIFLLYPFAFRKAFADERGPWLAAAFAGPVQFYLLWRAIDGAYAHDFIGALPLGFALLYLAALAAILTNAPGRNDALQLRLAAFGGVALLFLSLIFPLQFDREWLTIGWAVEGMALVWLFQRVPHAGLKAWGAALLAIAFVRLAVNPAVFQYHARSETPILNWYLYAYLAVAAANFVAARQWRPRGEKLGGVPVGPVLNGLGGILLFLLVNIEIADFFSTGSALTFQFSGNVARDLAYSLAWGLFGLAVLVVAIRSRSRSARIASLSLIIVTVLKLFLHDLWRLGGLYRVGAFVGLAVVLMLVSFLYQRYFSERSTPSTPPPPESE